MRSEYIAGKIKSMIDKIILNKDISSYLEKCNQKIPLPKEVIDYISIKNHKIIPFNKGEGELWTSREWLFDLGLKTKDAFRVKYSSRLQISKLVDVFYLHHEFAVENFDDERLAPSLDGFIEMPYTLQQAELEEVIVSSLERMGYSRISLKEMYEVVCDLKFEEDNFFGPQVTVEYVLFNDYLNVCPD
jgi:hypothetical protein